MSLDRNFNKKPEVIFPSDDRGSNINYLNLKKDEKKYI